MTIALDRLSPHPDRVYTAIMDAHAGLTEAQSHALNARLVLMMANRIGDADDLIDLLKTARAYDDD